jgi:hypothetical protein
MIPTVETLNPLPVVVIAQMHDRAQALTVAGR